MFDFKQPCVTCPFRRGQGELYRLRPGRLAEIKAATAFECHKTLVLDEDYIDDGLGEFDEQWLPVKDDSRAQQCAGLMAVLHREGEPSIACR